MSNGTKRYEAAVAEIGGEVRARWPDLWAADAVPAELWDRIAAAGLFGLSTPTAHGGAGLTVDEIARAARIFARTSGVQGLVTTWQAHSLMADWIFGRFASPAQQAIWSPRIATGASTLAFAVSEPDAGAHPKRLSTRATAVDGGYRIDGRKAYVTNGPIADLFAVVAVVEQDDRGRKRFGAFLTPADAPGLTVGQSEHVDFLKPSGHASLTLDGVFVPADARVGGHGDVYPIMVKPLRDHEDAPGAWSRLGAHERLAAAVAAADPVAAGAVAARLRAVEFMLDRDRTPEGLLAVRAILEDVRRRMAETIASHPDALDPGDAALAKDLGRLGEVARYAVDARFAALGRSLADCA